MTLGEKLKIARKQAGLSQEQLSEKLGVSRSAVAKWETDNGIPDVDNLKTLSRLLNVSIDYMLDNGEAIDELVITYRNTVRAVRVNGKTVRFVTSSPMRRSTPFSGSRN